MRKRRVLLRLPFFVLSSSFLALSGSARPAGAQWIVAAYAGAVHTAPGDIHIDNPSAGTALSFPDVPFDSDSWHSPIYYGYRVGRRLPGTRRFFVEGEFIHAKIFARAAAAPPGHGTWHGMTEQALPFRSLVQAYAMSHGLNFILVNVLVRQPLAPRLTVTARGGAGPMVPHREIEIDGRAVEGYERAGVGLQASAGAEIGLAPHLSAIVDYKYTAGRPRVTVPEGTTQVSTRSQHLAVGIAAIF